MFVSRYKDAPMTSSSGTLELVISKERNEWPSLAPNESWEKVSQLSWYRVCWGKFKIWGREREKARGSEAG